MLTERKIILLKIYFALQVKNKRMKLKKKESMIKVNKTGNLIIVFQQDATYSIILLVCRQLYMFRVLTAIIRSWYSCKYSFWY